MLKYFKINWFNTCVVVYIIITLAWDGDLVANDTNLTTARPTRINSARTYTANFIVTETCVLVGNQLRARHKSCFLRPDTGPCRADIIQWYYDVKQKKCYRFFWGGCQGNGNKFETLGDCLSYCHINDTDLTSHNEAHYCSLSFDYGTCFGYYNRWGFDNFEKTCKRRLYSGCGGNKNNFETLEECVATCISSKPKLLDVQTTCFPVTIDPIT